MAEVLNRKKKVRAGQRFYEALESIESALVSHSALNTSALSNACDLDATASFSLGVQAPWTASEPEKLQITEINAQNL